MTIEKPIKIISREEAKSIGLKRYNTGYPCIRGHAGDRSVYTTRCLSCLKEWSANNKEKTAARKRLYWKRVTSPVPKGSLARGVTLNKWGHRTNILFPDLKGGFNLPTPKWADAKKINLIYENCRNISIETGIQHHVDHIIPLRGKNVCGLHVENNLRIITADENRNKGSKFIEYLAYEK